MTVVLLVCASTTARSASRWSEVLGHDDGVSDPLEDTLSEKPCFLAGEDESFVSLRLILQATIR